MKIQHSDPLAVVKRAFFLAYQAATPLGFGYLRTMSDRTEDQVWENIVGAGDYPVQLNEQPETRPYADYVFGRMMKLGFTVTKDSIDCSDQVPRGDYQSWCLTYPTYNSLVDAAIASLA